MIRRSARELVIVLLVPLLAMCARQPELPDKAHVSSAHDAQVGLAHHVGDVTDAAETEIGVAAHLQINGEKALSLCENVEVGEFKRIFGLEFSLNDNLQVRLERAPVERSCIFEFVDGSGKPANEWLFTRLNGIRLDVFSDSKLRETEWWGTLDSNWEYRCKHQDYWQRLDNVAWTCWTETEHAPDKALLIRGEDFMFELGYYPPTSFRGAPETDRLIEQFASRLLKYL